MLSICIPIYMQNVTKLVTDLEQQMAQLSIPAELILIDDCSSDLFKNQNEIACSKHQYYKLEKNIGRSKIRNLFLKYAQYEYLLFLDCDAEVIGGSFLENYIPYLLESKFDVICGSSIYPKEKTNRDKRLRWKNGNVRETISPEKRMLKPHSSFMTSNVIIKKSIFDIITFDESLTKYGHEDTLFGYALMKKNIPILHIYNPVLNADLDTNKVFVNKMENALDNLVIILRSINFDPEFIQNNKLLSLYFKLKSKHIVPFVRFSFFFVKPIFRFLLTNGVASLFILDIYKFGVLANAFQRNK